MLANVLLNEVDKDLERRGHCFVRYADDANVYVRSKKAGERVMTLLPMCWGGKPIIANAGCLAYAGRVDATSAAGDSTQALEAWGDDV